MPVIAIRGRIRFYTRRMLAAAWCGAALFLASLAYFAYFYLVRLGQAPDVPAADIPRAVAVNIGLFSAFALHHSVFARSGAKAWLLRHVPPGTERACYVWLASLLFLAVCLLWQPLPGIAWQAAGPVRWLLRGVQVGGIVLTLQSASRIDIWDLSGVQQARAGRAAGTPAPAAAHPDPSAPPQSATPSSALEVGGPYRWLRHPIYLGWVLLVFGIPTMTHGRLLFAAVSTFYVVIAIPFEERSLLTQFGPAYGAYQRQVRWRLLPGIW
jgi:protein-S-isoprenylcysteine O-methyltransferase Ste14